MVRKQKRRTWMRGSHTHGYGAKKKHRGRGSRGGAGKSGKFKQKKTWFLKYMPEALVHKGHKGFTSINSVYGPEVRIANVSDLERLSAGKDKLTLVDTKVLGGGRITKPLTVEAAKFSKLAKKKIEASGGKAVETAS